MEHSSSSSSVAVVILTYLLFITGAKGQEIQLKPTGDTHTKQLGAQFLLTCEVGESSEDVDYKLQWIGTDGKEIVESTGRRYVEEESSSVKKLFITNITLEDAGYYTCKTSVSGNSLEKKIKLNVFKGITFDNAPSPQYLKIHTDALVRCEVSGDPKPEVSWRFKGATKIGFAAGGRYVKSDHGLTIKNVTVADSGEYTCRAIVESDGRMEEKKIQVEVHIPPTIREGPGIVNGQEGESARLTCSASENSFPKAKFEFFKNGRDEAVANSDTIRVDEVAGTVVFSSLKKSDEGNYTCTASNDVGKESATGTLRVLVKALVYELNNETRNETQTATLVCRSHGDPHPVMAFSKQGNKPFTVGESRDRVTVEKISAHELRMTIKQVKPDDSGNYVCSSTNRLGSHEKTGSITVNYKPHFSADSPRVVRGWAGVTRDVKCNVTGHPGAKIDWYLRGQLITENSSFSIRESEPTTDAPHNTVSHLSVTIGKADQTWIYTNYTCRATNMLGSDSLPIELKRAFEPSEPRSVTVQKHMPTMIVLDVDAPKEDGGVPLVGYRVQYKNQIYDVAVGTKIKLENLEPNKTYSLLVRAKNEVGVGPAINITTHTDPITSPFPVVITSSKRGRYANLYNVTWEHPETGGRPIKNYEFRLRPVQVEEVNGTVTLARSTGAVDAPGTQWQKYQIPDDASAPIINFLLTDLKELTWYQLEIRSENDQGWSRVNEQFLFQTSDERDHTAANTALPIGVGIVLAITIVVLIIILVVVDLSCYFVNNCGLTSVICTKVCGRTASLSKEKAAEEGDSKEALTEKQSPVKEPLNNETTTETTEKPAPDTTEAPAEADDLDEKPLLIDNADVDKVAPTDDKADDDDEPVKAKIEDDENDEKAEEQKEDEKKHDEPASQPTEATDSTKSSEPAAGDG